MIGIGGFYFGYDIGRMDHDEGENSGRAEKTTADSEISIRPVAKGWYWKNGDRNPDRMSGGCKDSLENLEKYNEQLQALMERHRIQKLLF